MPRVLGVSYSYKILFTDKEKTFFHIFFYIKKLKKLKN